MKRPSIRGLKTKALRVDPVGLAEFREELQASPEWAKYAKASESELVTIAVILASIYIRPEVVSMTVSDFNHIVDEAVRNAISGVATALGGVAQMNQDHVISVTRPQSDSIETFQAKPVKPKSTPLVHYWFTNG